MTLVSGWCITDDHEICPYIYATIVCTCDCHEENDEATDSQVEVVEEATGLDHEVEEAQGIEDDTQRIGS